MIEVAINNIQRKLRTQEPLSENEIYMVMTALRKQHDYTQKPYYEVIYHDEYDRQEKRIMNPVSHNARIAPEDNQYLMISDVFELHFNRFVERKNGE